MTITAESSVADRTSVPLFDPVELLAGDGPRARATDPITSHEAADSTQGKKLESQNFVHRLLTATGPVADFELQFAADDHFDANPDVPRWSPSRLRTARHELTAQGRVVDTGYFHLTGSGRRAQVWEAC